MIHAGQSSGGGGVNVTAIIAAAVAVIVFITVRCFAYHCHLLDRDTLLYLL